MRPHCIIYVADVFDSDRIEHTYSSIHTINISVFLCYTFCSSNYPTHEIMYRLIFFLKPCTTHTLWRKLESDGCVQYHIFATTADENNIKTGKCYFVYCRIIFKYAQKSTHTTHTHKRVAENQYYKNVLFCLRKKEKFSNAFSSSIARHRFFSSLFGLPLLTLFRISVSVFVHVAIM